MSKDQQKAYQIAAQAKRENLENVDYLTDTIPKSIQNMNDYIDRLYHVNQNFKELEFFKGRFLRHIYEHKREIEHRQAEEAREVVIEVKNKPPENNQLEMRKIK